MSEIIGAGRSWSVWLRPRGEGFSRTYGPPRLQGAILIWLWSVCFNVSGLGSRPRPRWRPARPDPHNQSGLQVGPFKLSGFQAAVRLSGHLYLTQTSLTRRREGTPRQSLHYAATAS